MNLTLQYIHGNKFESIILPINLCSKISKLCLICEVSLNICNKGHICNQTQEIIVNFSFH